MSKNSSQTQPKRSQQSQQPQQALQPQQLKQTTQNAANAAVPEQGRAQDAGSGYSKEEQEQETAKAAQQSLERRQKAENLMKAAMGAGDSEHRQHLLQEALNQEVEAESFGKVAKWLQTGAFQGFIRGSIPGVTLGALTGTLVGGVVSLVTGGLGAGIGALTGPSYKLGDMAGKGLRWVTGDWGGWETTQEQRDMLEKMALDVNNQDAPSQKDLQEMTGGWKFRGSQKGKDGKKQTWSEYASSWMPTKDSPDDAGGQSEAGKGQGAEHGGKGAGSGSGAMHQASQQSINNTASSLQTRTNQAEGKKYAPAVEKPKQNVKPQDPAGQTNTNSAAPAQRQAGAPPTKSKPNSGGPRTATAASNPNSNPGAKTGTASTPAPNKDASPRHPSKNGPLDSAADEDNDDASPKKSGRKPRASRAKKSNSSQPPSAQADQGTGDKDDTPPKPAPQKPLKSQPKNANAARPSPSRQTSTATNKGNLSSQPPPSRKASAASPGKGQDDTDAQPSAPSGGQGPSATRKKPRKLESRAKN